MIRKITETTELPSPAPLPVHDVASLRDFIINALEDEKAEDIQTIDLQGKSDIADYMVITSGRSNRHVGAIADNLVKKLKTVGINGVTLEGMEQCDWVLVDAFDIIIHIFRPEIRELYNLEKMWSMMVPEVTA
jgi:ribosome-associated protein